MRDEQDLTAEVKTKTDRAVSEPGLDSVLSIRDIRRRLVKALQEASRERVVLVIAHRLSTIRAADQILFLREGRVVERGTHTELLLRPEGEYRRFVELQAAG